MTLADQANPFDAFWIEKIEKGLLILGEQLTPQDERLYSYQARPTSRPSLAEAMEQEGMAALEQQAEKRQALHDIMAGCLVVKA